MKNLQHFNLIHYEVHCETHVLLFFLKKKTPKTWEISLVLKIFRENQPHIHYICAQSLSINCSAKPIVLVNFEIWISTFCAKTNLFAIYSQHLDRLWNSTEKLIITSSEPIEIEFSSSACISQEASEVSVRIKFAIECVPGRRAYVTFITNRFSFRNQYFISQAQKNCKKVPWAQSMGCSKYINIYTSIYIYKKHTF